MQSKKITLVFILLVFFTMTAHAGLISLLSKAGKAVNKIDIDVPISKFDLPNIADDVTPISIKPRHSGEWDLTLPDGKRVTLSEFIKNNKGHAQQAFVIKSLDLPSDLSIFNSIPDSLPVFIKSGNNRIFELQHGSFTALKYKNIQVVVDDMTGLKESLWHLERPPINNSIRIIQLEKNSKELITEKSYGSGVAVEKVSADSIYETFRNIKRQTVVLSGKIKDGQLYNGSENFSIEQLRKIAAENDISLVIIESNKHTKVLKKIAVEATARKNDVKHLYDTTGDFLNRFKDPANSELLRIKLNQMGNSQSVIQFQPVVKESINQAPLEAITDIGLVPFHLLGKSVSLYRPDQERSKELDGRIFSWIPTPIQNYLIASIILGWLAVSTSWTLWNKIWKIQKRPFYSNYFVFRGFGLFHASIFVFAFIPLFGVFSFIYAVVSVIVKIINTLFIKPVVWIVGKVAN